ncbi:bifunctional RNase H/acid phosphatase [Nakamurella leprariae]|uniref:Bifunctional RNase H/acid phosphatase n=1 Tax=Nakamurella leprariae TaxID=2803911 RepID=A0A939BYT4_9ACTN|nr:bifunctional RNase H/acid phosphatase [Nakamurella leprariae]MBM9466961.1 bifunctional RNase H/acid phosphatase [Nakamurella leprariae]
MTAGSRDSAQTKQVTVFADGGSRGNPGPAGYGAVVFAGNVTDPATDAARGTVLAERAAAIGRATNNVAEYSGLIAGLEAAAELDARLVAVRMDSKLVVEQMSGRWQIKHPDMKPLARRAAELIRGFDGVTFEWVPRARNRHADRLANEAMDAAAEGLTWQPPARDTASDEDTEDDGGLFGTAVAREAVGAPTPQDPAAAAAGPEAATQVVVVRHGETVLGAQGRFAGRTDVELTDRGRRQADELAARLDRLRPTVVLTSPLQRCRDTAAAIATRTGAPVVEHDGLLDGTLGDWTGCTPTEIGRGWAKEFSRWRRDPAAAPPGGESFVQIRQRVRPVLDEVVRRYRGGTVVLVTHAAVTKMLLVQALDAPDAMAYRFRVDTASVSGFGVEADGSTLVWALNETGHLLG